MSMEQGIQIRASDVFAVTDEENRELKRGSTDLSQAALELMVLLDGKSSLAEISAQASNLPAETIRQTAQLLLDVELPDINGFDILAGMRAHPQLKSIPVIMLTGLARREDVMRGLAGGADGYVTKPFDRDVLITGIRSVLGLR